MQKDVFWARARSLCEHNVTIARGLSEARREYFKYKDQLYLIKCIIEWRSPLTPEGRRIRLTRKTSRLFWLSHELELEIGWKEEWIRQRIRDLREGKRRIADWHRLHLVAAAQLQGAQTPETRRLLRDVHWWRIRWFIANEWSNPFVVASIQEEEGSDQKRQRDTEWLKHRSEWKGRIESNRQQSSSSSSSTDVT